MVEKEKQDRILWFYFFFFETLTVIFVVNLCFINLKIEYWKTCIKIYFVYIVTSYKCKYCVFLYYIMLHVHFLSFFSIKLKNKITTTATDNQRDG